MSESPINYRLSTINWFQDWFADPRYLELYGHRDDEEANELVTLIEEVTGADKNPTTRIGDDELIEQRRYDDALAIYREVAERHPITFTSLIDVRRRIDDLEAKVARPVRPPR
jgi:hypothetical protein